MRRSALVLPLAIVASACATAPSVESELSLLRRDLAQVKKELAETRLEVQRLEGQVTVLGVGRSQTPTTQVAAAPRAGQSKAGEARAPAKVLPVVRLSSKAEPAVVDESWTDPGATDDGSPPILIKLGPEAGGEERLPVDHEVLKKPNPLEKKPSAPPEEPSNDQLEQEYGQALAKLRAENKPGEAQLLFEAFEQAHPRSKLADNAAFWAAECLVAQGEAAKAVGAFERLLSTYPRSSKRPDALDRSAELWLSLGDRPRAQKLSKEVVSKYPSSEAAGRARARLETLAR